MKKFSICNAPLKEIFSSKHTFHQVFTNDQEAMLVSYVLKCSRMNWSLTYTLLRTLAYEYAVKLSRTFSATWEGKSLAGLDWVDLSLHKPENTNLSGGTSFNKTIVMNFYDNYNRTPQKYFFAARISNLDETGVMTVVQAPNVIAEKGIKQVGQAVSGECENLVTMVGIVSALENTVPPVFILPRARFHKTLVPLREI